MTLTEQQIADGWKPHDGGDGPDSAISQVMFRDGEICPSGGAGLPLPAHALMWWHGGQDDDIIAYREVQP